MTRQTLRDWVHRYAADGVARLRSLTGAGRPPLLNAAQMQQLRGIVLTGPGPERHAVFRWRCADLCEEVAARWSVRVCAQTMGEWLRRLAPARRDAAGSRQPYPSAAAARFAGTEPDGERLGLSARQQAQSQGVEHLRGDRPRLRRSMALPDRRSLAHPVDRLSLMGVCQTSGGLASLPRCRRLLSACRRLPRRALRLLQPLFRHWPPWRVGRRLLQRSAEHRRRLPA